MSVQTIQHKIYESLKPSGWASKLKMFIFSSEFENIILTLHNEVQEDLRFTPILKDLFKPFILCPYHELKIIMLNQDPYIVPNIANGLAFSSYGDKPQTPLKLMLEEIDNTVYSDGHTWKNDLTDWSKQGILLLNTSLTTRIKEPGKHIDLWKPFMQFLFDSLSTYNSGIIYVFFGNNVKQWSKYINANNYKFFVTHPVSGNYKVNKHWDSGDLFNKINHLMFNIYKEKITW